MAYEFRSDRDDVKKMTKGAGERAAPEASATDNRPGAQRAREEVRGQSDADPIPETVEPTSAAEKLPGRNKPERVR